MILIIIAVLNFFVGLIVILRHPKNKINLSFGLLLFSVVGWSIGLAMSRELAGTSEALSWSRSTYFFAIFISLTLFYFSLAFPYQKSLSFAQKVMTISPALILTLVLAVQSNFIIKEMVVMPWGYDNVYQSGYTIFSLVFSFYFILAFINFIKNIIKSEGVLKKHLVAIAAGFALAGIFGIVFDLILPYFGNWKFNWFGPYFSIILLFIIAYSLFYKPNKNTDKTYQIISLNDRY
ncbi:MAG: hypothetical protein UW91_C0042G0010 [Parcubacteria group bacterium GW2011_GWF2_45_11]|nr:MAG: hypothetical protein UW91_C0042G0010 [Parcubacteria group bacterium GW2011_GWF2_45_11]